MYSTKKDVYRYLLPNLLEIQRASFCWFLEKGLIQELENFSVIRDYLGELELSFSTKFYKIKKPKYTLDEAKRRDTTYSVRIYVTANLKYLQQGETKKRRNLSWRCALNDK
jgi:DNA-directed RNA polymerase subunit beta